MTIIEDPRPVVYLGLGNSDGKLKPTAWAELCEETSVLLERFAYEHRASGAQYLGSWFSSPATPFLSAVFAAVLPAGLPAAAEELRHEVRRLAAAYDQRSIAWAHAFSTFLLGPPNEPEPADAVRAA